MEKTRQLLPAGLAEMPPGPGLAAVLAGIDLSRLSGLDCIEAMLAQARQTSHEQARLMAAMVEVGLCGIGPDDQLPRMEAPDEFAADEIRAALAWTRRAAEAQLSLAWDLIGRLPDVFAALDAGRIDVPKARVFSEWTAGLTDEQAHRISDALLPDAPGLTTGKLSDRIKKLAIALDPDWARRRYEEAVRDRKVVGYRNEDGTGNLCGYSMPADKVAAACAHIDALAKRIKQAGDRRPIDHIRADLFLGMLDGSYDGWSETDIIAYASASAATEAAATEAAATERTGGPSATETADGPSATETAGQRDDVSQRGDVGGDHRDNSAEDELRNVAHRFSRPDGRNGHDRKDDQNTPESDDHGSAVEAPQGPGLNGDSGSARRAGVEIRAELTTLLSLDDHPAEIAGWGHVHADLARRLVADQTGAEWRYALTDEDGCLLYEGITRARPDGYPSRAEAPCRGGIVELQIPLSVLRRLAARPARLGGWAKVIADLARQADQHEQQSPDFGDQDTGGEQGPGRGGRGAEQDGRGAEQGGRSPRRAVRRHTQIRDRICTHPGCRTPASGTDGDHTRDWADGGPTRDENIGSLCRHDHRVKHEGGWTVAQPAPGHFLWQSRLGRHYYVRPPLIIQQLPDPIPREPMYRHLAQRYKPDDGDDPVDASTWREPSSPPESVPESKPTLNPDPADQIPPF